MGKKNRRPPASEPPEDGPLDEPAAEPDASDRVMTQFARNLATGNRKTRAQALGAVEKWLAGRGEGASELELRKLWRGIFFCVWMVDKAHVQLEVSRTIARLVHCFATPAHAARWLRCWGATLRGEWGKLDKHRIDKYYTLIRQVVVEAVAYVRARAWAADACEALVGALDAELVRQLPNGPRLHLADVLLEALGVADEAGDEVAADGDSDGDGEPGPSAAVLVLLLQPFVAQLALTADAPVVRRVLERLVRPLLEQCRRGREEPEAAAAWHGGFVAWLGARAFAIASAPATPDANREALYATAKQCQKLGAGVGVAGPSEAAAFAPAKPAPAKSASKAKRSLVVEDDDDEEPAPERPTKTKKGIQKRKRK